MDNVVTREAVLNTLRAWQRGELTNKQVYDWANERFATDIWETEDEITNEVLGRLDTLDMTSTTADDIPALIDALSFPPSSVDQAVQVLTEHYSKINTEERKKECLFDPLYAPFCK